MDIFKLIQKGSFAVLSMAITVSADTFDPVDDWGSNATVMVIDETIQTHGPHSLDASDTNDWFQFTLSAGVPYLIEATGSMDTDAFLYSDSDGTILAVPDGAYQYAGEGQNFKMDYLPTVSGNYYLRVKPIGAAGVYTLQYTIPSADAWDPTDNIGTNATTLTVGAAAKIHGSHALNETDHYDWFQFNLSSGTVYQFESTGNDDTKGYLYASPLSGEETGTDANDGWEMKSDDEGDGFNFRIDYPCSQDGTYYVLTRSFNVGDDSSYDFLYYIPANDSDGDQLLDSWEMEYFTDLTAEPNLHGDLDQFTNLEEYIAGTDPTNSASFFAMTNGLVGGSFVVEWSSVAAREYAVLWAESLTNSFMPQGLPIDHPQNSYTDTAHNAESSGFYKVEVQLK